MIGTRVNQEDNLSAVAENLYFTAKKRGVGPLVMNALALDANPVHLRPSEVAAFAWLGDKNEHALIERVWLALCLSPSSSRVLPLTDNLGAV